MSSACFEQKFHHQEVISVLAAYSISHAEIILYIYIYIYNVIKSINVIFLIKFIINHFKTLHHDTKTFIHLMTLYMQTIYIILI